MPKISVIVPVYNTEKYIERCLNSIKNQTMKDIEIIIINDGSTDHSEAVIKQWIEKNQNKINIQYWKKENGGLSDARNYGVQHATGEYLSFIDSDDYIDKNLYKNLEKYGEQNIDLIKFKMQTIDEKENKIEKLDGPIFEKCTGEEAFEKLCTKDTFLEVACIYLYRREFFMNYHFSYTVGTYHEDFGLTPLILIQAQSVISTNEYGYYYSQTNNSIVRNSDYQKDKKKVKDVLLHYDNAVKKIDKMDISKQSKERIKRYYTNTVIIKAKNLKGNDFEEYIKEIKERKLYRNIQPYNGKQRIKRFLLRFNVKLYLKMK